MNFNLTTDKTSFIITVLVWLTPAFALVLFKLFGQSLYWKVSLPIVVFMLLISIVVYLLSPQKYSVQSGELIIYRLVKPLKYKLNQIEKVKQLTQKQLGLKYRKFGSGGFHGYFGWYVRSDGRNVLMFTKSMRNLIEIELKGGKVLILSPQKTDQFLGMLEHEIDNNQF